MFMVIVHCRVLPEHRAAFLAGAADLRDATRNESGNLAYDYFENPADEGHMAFIEEWRSRADIDAHMACPHTRAFLQIALSMLASPPSMRVFEVARSESLM